MSDKSYFYSILSNIINSFSSFCEGSILIKYSSSDTYLITKRPTCTAWFEFSISEYFPVFNLKCLSFWILSFFLNHYVLVKKIILKKSNFGKSQVRISKACLGFSLTF